MSSEERTRHKWTVVGADLAECSLCGGQFSSVELRAIDSPSTLAEHDQVDWACPTCWERVLRGEIEIESLLPDEDEVRGRTEQG